MFTISNDKKLKIWNITSGTIQYAYDIDISYTINFINKSISYAGLDLSKTNPNTMVLAGSDGTVKIYNLTSFYNPTYTEFKFDIYANFIGINKNNNRVIATGYNLDSYGIGIYDYDGNSWIKNTPIYDRIIKY